MNKQAQKLSKQISVLLQVHIAQEETKFGLDENELEELLNTTNDLPNVRIEGLMGMASFTENKDDVRREFQTLGNLFNKYASHQTSNLKFQILSMGMSADYEIAMQEGSTMVRIGSLLFGERV